jgi:hypothetical protein
MSTFDARKFENPLQIGGIRTGSLDYPNPGGGQSCRVAHFNTGAGLRFTVALDRGGDIVEASYNDTNLAYLSPNDYRPPSHSMHRGLEWLVGWPAGLLTTAGPGEIGEPRTEEGRDISLHGRHSNTPAAVISVINPDPARGELAMRLIMAIRDTRMFGPSLEVSREIACELGSPSIRLRDKVTNCGDQPAPHAWLYHVNFGYPLLDEGVRLLYGGTGTLFDFRGDQHALPTAEQVKRTAAPDASYAGAGEQVVLVDSLPDKQDISHMAIVNDRRQLALELSYPTKALPRFANWLHFGPRGSYVAAFEPFYGSLFGKANDNHTTATATLEPGETRNYELNVAVRTTPDQLSALAKFDQPLDLQFKRM